MNDSEFSNNALRRMIDIDDNSSDDSDSRSLFQMDLELQKLFEEQNESRRKGQTFLENQKKQTQLVEKLQIKVLHYKEKCRILESKLQLYELDSRKKMYHSESNLGLGTSLKSFYDNGEYESILIQLEEEQKKNKYLTEINHQIQEQLTLATHANKNLSRDLANLSEEWNRSRHEIENKEKYWQNEKKIYNDQFSSKKASLQNVKRVASNFQHQFIDLKASTERELDELKREINRQARCLQTACSNLTCNMKSLDSKQQLNNERESQDRINLESQIKALTGELSELTKTNERLKSQCLEKDRNLTTLQVNKNNDSFGETNKEDKDNRILREENSRMQQTLQNISQIIRKDSENSHFDHEDSNLSRTRMNNNGSQSPKRNRSASPDKSSSLTDLTYISVQSALNKKTFQIQELKSKLNSSKDNCTNLKKQINENENEQRQLENQLMNMREEMENLRLDRDDSLRDANRLKNTVNVISEEKNELLKAHSSLQNKIDEQVNESERLKAKNQELIRLLETVEEQHEYNKKDLERKIKENVRYQKSVESLEDKIGKLKEDIMNYKEAVDKYQLEKEVLIEEKEEVDEALKRFEISNMDLEEEVKKHQIKQINSDITISKLTSDIEDLNEKETELNRIMKEMENEKLSLLNEKRLVEQQKYDLKEELVRSKQEGFNLSDEIATCRQEVEQLEINLQKSKEKMSKLNQYKEDLIEQAGCLQRQKSALAEELLQSRKEIERITGFANRLSKEKQNLFNERDELIVQIKTSENDNRQQLQVISSLNSDREQLESTLYEAQQLILQMETRKEQLEEENQELLNIKDNLNGELIRSRREFQIEFEKMSHSKDHLISKCHMIENELRQMLQKEKESHSDDVEKLTQWNECTRREFEEEKEELIYKYNVKENDLIKNYEQEKQDLAHEIMTIQKERDDSLIMIKNDKQKCLTLMEEEKCAMKDKFLKVQNQLDIVELEYERLKQESYNHQEQDKKNISFLSNELNTSKLKFEDFCQSHELQMTDLNNIIRDLSAMKDQSLKEVHKLQIELKIAEECRDNLRREIMDLGCHLKETQEINHSLKHDLNQMKHSLLEDESEKEAIINSMECFRKKIQSFEKERNDSNKQLCEAKQKASVLDDKLLNSKREISDLRNCLKDTEKSRLDTKKELKELKSVIKDLYVEREKLCGELNDLRNRVSKDEEREDEIRKETLHLTEKIAEAETYRDNLKKELHKAHRYISELKEILQNKDKEISLMVHNSRKEYRKLSQINNNLQQSYDSALCDIKELKMVLTDWECRTNDLESNIAKVEEIKREMELKLVSIHNSLRRVIGFKQEQFSEIASNNNSKLNIRNNSKSPHRARSQSPEGKSNSILRNRSPTPKGRLLSSQCPSNFNPLDINPESVRVALEELVQQLISIERERDNYVTLSRNLESRLKEQEMQNEYAESRLQQLQQALCDAVEDKKGIDCRLLSAQTALMMQEESIRRNERDRKLMNEKISSLNQALASLELEKRHQEETMNKILYNDSKIEEESRHYKKSFENAENKIEQFGSIKRALESEVHRMKMMVADKESENDVLKDRQNCLMKQIEELEEKCESLQLTVNRMNVSLTKTEEEGNFHKDKMHELNESLTNHSQQLHHVQEKASQLQMELGNSEHSRLLLAERMECNNLTLKELKDQNHLLMERIQVIQADLNHSENRRSELEGFNRQTSALLIKRQEGEQELNRKYQKLTVEKNKLQERLNILQQNLTLAEAEKIEMIKNGGVEKEKLVLKSGLEKSDKKKMIIDDVIGKTGIEKSELDKLVGKLQDENYNLRKQNENLQNRISKHEQIHSNHLMERNSKTKEEMNICMKDLKGTNAQAERNSEGKERVHRHKNKELEKQI